MKIAIDVRDAAKEKTGKGWYVFNILEQLFTIDKKNHYILYSNSKTNPFQESKNIEFRSMEAKPSKWHFLVIKDIQKEKVDLFFAPSSYIIPAFCPTSIKMVMTVHDLVSHMFPANHNKKAVIIERLTLKRAIKRADKIFVVSENTKKDLLKRFTYPESRITTTYCAPAEYFNTKTSEEDLQKFKEKMKYPDNFVLAVGTLEPRKNFATLIRSFSTIKKKHPDFKLVIVGKQGWKFKQIEETIKQYKLEEEVIFPGYLKDNDLKNTYKLAKVFVFPSLYEGFGIPPLEAMASGCPVVSSNVASLPEVIGDAGLLVDPTNPYKLAEAVSSLIENEQVRQKMIERGHGQVQKFHWKNSAEIALQAFKEMNNENEAN